MSPIGRLFLAAFFITMVGATLSDVDAQSTTGALFAYPMKGQTPEQQGADRAACHEWAVAQTGHDPSLRALLKRHDPAAGEAGLTQEERIRLRRAVVGATGRARGRTGHLRRALVGTLALATLVVGLGLWKLRPRPDTAPPVASAVRPAPESREVHIVTPGGTQVVWILSSDFRF